MNIFEQVYFQIINESSKDIIKYNDFPEDVEFIDITKEISHRHEIYKIILPNHGIKSVNSDGSIHGANYVDIPKWKIFKIIDLSLQKMFNYFNENEQILFNKNLSFEILITTKSNRKNI